MPPEASLAPAATLSLTMPWMRSICARLITGPSATCPDVGSPTGRCLARSLARRRGCQGVPSFGRGSGGSTDYSISAKGTLVYTPTVDDVLAELADASPAQIHVKSNWFDERLIKGEWPPPDLELPRTMVTVWQTDL